MSHAKVIDGKAFSLALRQQITKQVEALKTKHAITPGLAVVLVGDDPASQVYVRNKGKQTTEAGMQSFEYLIPADVTEEALLEKVNELNEHPDIHGILVQLPLPSHLNETLIINAINPDKDVDGFHISNVGKLATGQQGTVPCTPLGCLLLLKDTLGGVDGCHAVVIGRSNIVGKPMAQLLLKENCTVTMAHSRTKDLADECRRADIIVSAVGKPHMIKGDWIKSGATVIDVGINRITTSDGKSKLIGDVCFDEVVKVAGAVTPVPGGVGPMTIACLLKNTLELACRQHGVDMSQLLAP